MEIYLAGRATAEFQDPQFPVDEPAKQECPGWFQRNLHALDLEKHVRLHNLIRPGSSDLVELFSRQFETGALRANDTSYGVGHAPFSLLENLVYQVERFITYREHIAAHPEIGEDVKVMGIRRDSRVRLILACAFVDRFIMDMDTYLDRKAALAARIREFSATLTGTEVDVEINSVDEPKNWSIYLTVIGTSAECGDDGEAGRGNRVNGLITPCRAMTMESAADKNPITHVGKLCNIADSRIAAAIVGEVETITDACCFLTSQIGHPIREPELTEIRYRTRRPGGSDADKRLIEEIVRRELAGIRNYWRELLHGTTRDRRLHGFGELVHVIKPEVPLPRLGRISATIAPVPLRPLPDLRRGIVRGVRQCIAVAKLRNHIGGGVFILDARQPSVVCSWHSLVIGCLYQFLSKPDGNLTCLLPRTHILRTKEQFGQQELFLPIIPIVGGGLDDQNS